MTRSGPLPLEDQPFGRLVDADPGAPASYVEQTPTNPVWVAAVFASIVLGEEPTRDDDLQAIVTPASSGRWDFTAVAVSLAGKGMVTTATYYDDETAYVRFVPGVDAAARIEGDLLMTGGLVVTLRWKPEAGMWLVHAVGDYWRPNPAPLS